MDQIQTLRDQRKTKLDEARGILDAASRTSRDLTPNERLRHDALVKDVESLTDRIDRETRTSDHERQQRALTGHRPGAEQGQPGGGSARIGLSTRERSGYSLLRAATAYARRDWRGADLEREASTAVASQLGTEPRGFYVPSDVWESRTLEKGGGASGAALVATDHFPESFIDVLRNRTMVLALGATVLPDLVGDVEIPRRTGSSTAYWLAEGGTVTASDQVFDKVTMTPHTLAGRTNVTRRMLLQGTPGSEELVRQDLVAVLGIELDRAAINGSGASNQPTGILATSGIGSVAGGTNGLAPTWAHIVDLENALATANADTGALGYLTNAKVRKKLKTTEKATNTGLFVFENGAGGMGALNGYRAAVSNQVPSTLTKGSASGVCSAILFGNFADLIIGQWGALDVKADEVTLGDSGGLVLRAFLDVDVAVRHAASFAAMLDALTT